MSERKEGRADCKEEKERSKGGEGKIKEKGANYVRISSSRCVMGTNKEEGEEWRTNKPFNNIIM